MSRRIGNVENISHELDAFTKNVSTKFYSVECGVIVFDFFKHEQKSFIPQIDDIRAIFAESSFEEQPKDFHDAKIIEISRDEAIESFLLCARFRGDPRRPDIIEEEVKSRFCESNFGELMKSYGSRLGLDDLRYFELISDEESFFNYFANWGFCYIITNEQRKWGVFLHVNPSF